MNETMNTNEIEIEAMGAGTGALKVNISSAARAGLVRTAAREWSPNRGKWSPVAIRRGARGAGAAFLSSEARTAVVAFVSERLAFADFSTVCAAICGESSSAAVAEVRHLLRWAESLGVVVVESVKGGGSAVVVNEARAAVEAERVRVHAERLEAVQVERRKLHLAYEVGEVSGLGTAEAIARRAVAPEGSPLPGKSLLVVEVANPARVALFKAVCVVAEARGRKWARGTHSSAKGAANRREIGPAAGADDLGDYWERLTAEAVGWYRWAAMGRASLLAAHIEASGARVNRSARRNLATLRGSERDGRAACEAWEYAAVKGRDGREVGGGWALQGAVHGLRDFWIQSVTPGESAGEVCADDLGAGEWSAMLDQAAAALDLGGDAAPVVELSPEMQAAVNEAADVATLGGLSWAPNAGAGSGLRPSVAAGLDAWASDAREAMGARVKSAQNAGAAATAAAAAARAAALVEGLLSFVRDGSALDGDTLAEFFGADGKLSKSGQKRVERLRKAARIESASGPARGVEVRPPSRLPSVAGDEVTISKAAARHIRKLCRHA